MALIQNMLNGLDGIDRFAKVNLLELKEQFSGKEYENIIEQLMMAGYLKSCAW